MKKSLRDVEFRMQKGLAIITGASSGIGAEFAHQLAGRGHSVLLIARRLDRLKELAAKIAASNSVKAEVLAADLSSAAELEGVAARLRSEEVDILVNGAGFGIVGRFFEVDFAAMERMVRVHVDATLRLSKAVLPGMIARDRGSVVNVSSLAAYMAMHGNAVYTGTKAFIHSFTRSLELDLANRCSHIRVQVLCPGFTRTEFHADMQEQVAHIPRWAWMSAEDVVDASLRGLDRNQIVVVPGWRNKLLIMILSMIPARTKRNLGLRFARRAR